MDNKLYIGNTLTGLSGKSRPAMMPRGMNKLGYWTDNGAAYYYKDLRCYAARCWRRASVCTNGFPLGYMQLDSWWYPKGVANTWAGR